LSLRAELKQKVNSSFHGTGWGGNPNWEASFKYAVKCSSHFENILSTLSFPSLPDDAHFELILDLLFRS
jgi:hypothetical protein